jgi:translation initiation factor 3 subunit B
MQIDTKTDPKEIIQCSELLKLLKYYPELQFDEELAAKPEIAEFLRQAIQRHSMTVVDPLTLPDAPKFNDDFTNYFVINNLPKCKAEKIPKLVTLIEATLKKKSLHFDEDAIDIPINGATEETDGVAFVKMRNEEDARLGVTIFDGFKLTKNNIFAACLFPEFEKIMTTAEDFEMPQAAANFEDLRAPIFDIKTEQYLFKSGNSLELKKFQLNQSGSDSVLSLAKASDKAITFSPMGTYMIVIKSDKVIFMGGKDMIPIITLPQQKVDKVVMSPCEKYVLTFAPLSDVGFTIWDFQMVQVLREFECERELDEDHTSWKWSHDGKYIAKRFRSETEKDGKTKVKEGVSIYELPTMELLKTVDGVKKSLSIEAMAEWMWVPGKDMIAYTAHMEEPATSNIMPQVAFISLPSRR